MAPKKAPAWNADVMLLDTLFAVEDVIAKSSLKLVRAMVVPMKAESYPNLDIPHSSPSRSHSLECCCFLVVTRVRVGVLTHSREPKARMVASRYRRQL